MHRQKYVLINTMPLILLGLSVGIPIADAADTHNGASFSHHDWEVVCDNTRTCRAEGYSEEGAEQLVSVLLTRKAGPNEPVRAEMRLGEDEDEGHGAKASVQKLTLIMRINNKEAGHIDYLTKEASVVLTSEQTKALLVALPGTAKIEWVNGKKHWRLSNKGASAVLLKMDDVQGRVGTPGALIKKGARDENTVSPTIPMPVVTIPPLPELMPSDKQLASSKDFIKAMTPTIEKDCPDRREDDKNNPTIELYRLSKDTLLMSTTCWMAAYNLGDGYWVIKDKPPYQAEFVTDSGSGYDKGEITSGQKGRGVGDCWGAQRWAWNGQHFVVVDISTTGMCRGFAGGTWNLPTVTAQVKHQTQ